MKNVLKLAVLVLAISMFTGCLSSDSKGPVLFSTQIEGFLNKAVGSGAPALNSPNFGGSQAFDIDNINSLKIYIG